MPTYDYQCLECEEIFEIFCKISELDSSKPCPKCGSTNTEKRIFSAPGACDSVSLGREKHQRSFKEVLRNIDKRTPGSVIHKTTDI